MIWHWIKPLHRGFFCTTRLGCKQKISILGSRPYFRGERSKGTVFPFVRRCILFYLSRKRFNATICRRLVVACLANEPAAKIVPWTGRCARDCGQVPPKPQPLLTVRCASFKDGMMLWRKSLRIFTPTSVLIINCSSIPFIRARKPCQLSSDILIPPHCGAPCAVGPHLWKNTKFTPPSGWGLGSIKLCNHPVLPFYFSNC